MSMLDLLSTIESSPRREHRLYGVSVGIVTNNQDPDELGRVKVKFPWLSDDTESFWVRVATPMAGKDRGMFFLPEVADEVLVAFMHGDIMHPVVIGSLWNGVDKPPRTNSDGKNNERVIHSRSGHELIFCDDDTGKQEKVEIRTNGGHSILLDDSAGKEKIVIKDKGGSSVEIDSTANTVTIKSTMQLKVEATNIEIKATGNMKLSSGGPLEIRGAMVKLN